MGERERMMLLQSVMVSGESQSTDSTNYAATPPPSNPSSETQWQDKGQEEEQRTSVYLSQLFYS